MAGSAAISRFSSASESCSFLGHSGQTRRVGVFLTRNKSGVYIAVGRGTAAEPQPEALQAARLSVGVGVAVGVEVWVGVSVEVGVAV